MLYIKLRLMLHLLLDVAHVRGQLLLFLAQMLQSFLLLLFVLLDECKVLDGEVVFEALAVHEWPPDTVVPFFIETVA